MGKYAQGNPDQNNSSSAAARSSTGGSLGSLHDLTDIKVSEKPIDNQKGVASRSRGGKKKNSIKFYIYQLIYLDFFTATSHLSHLIIFYG